MARLKNFVPGSKSPPSLDFRAEATGLKYQRKSPRRKSVDGVGSDGVGHVKQAREDSPDVSPGFGSNGKEVEEGLKKRSQKVP